MPEHRRPREVTQVAGTVVAVQRFEDFVFLPRKAKADHSTLGNYGRWGVTWIGQNTNLLGTAAPSVWLPKWSLEITLVQRLAALGSATGVLFWVLSGSLRLLPVHANVSRLSAEMSNDAIPTDAGCRCYPSLRRFEKPIRNPLRHL